MRIENTVIKISGDKLGALLVTEDSMLFSSQYCVSPEEFKINWNKKLSLAITFNVKYAKVKSVVKNDDEPEVKVNYRSIINVPSQLEFTFNEKVEEKIFFTYLEKEQYFIKNQFRLSKFKAILPYLLGILLVVLSVAVSHYSLTDLQVEKVYVKPDSKTMLFNKLISYLGFKGIWAIGILISIFIITKITKRFKNPPQQTKLIPPNT
jgi:hypothetical protein